MACGVHYRGKNGIHEIRADVTIWEDGWFSRCRKLLGIEPIKTSPPMDVLCGLCCKKCVTVLNLKA